MLPLVFQQLLWAVMRFIFLGLRRPKMVVQKLSDTELKLHVMPTSIGQNWKTTQGMMKPPTNTRIFPQAQLVSIVSAPSILPEPALYQIQSVQPLFRYQGHLRI